MGLTSTFSPIFISFFVSSLVSLVLFFFSFYIDPLALHIKKRLRPFFYALLILVSFLVLTYVLFLKMGIISFFHALLSKAGISLGTRAISLAVTRCWGWDGGLLIVALLLLYFSVPDSLNNMVSSGSSSEQSVNQQPVIPELHPPLLDDETRRQGLNSRFGAHLFGLSHSLAVRDAVVETQLQIEKHLEGALVADGYSRDAVFAKIDQIRGFVFYPGGAPLYESTYRDHLKQIQENGTRQSVPYRRILRAIQNYDLF